MRNRLHMKAAGAVIAGGALLIAAAAPASAATLSGFRSCGAAKIVALASVSSGTTKAVVGSWTETRTLGTNAAANWYSNQQAGDWAIAAPTVLSASSSCVSTV
ncbi:hypothetical protein [Xylanimonas sp. McL0601]|uniref:hypothetical protein n=1 Tax=Xylanimonas sp. McL0601 TaxID=3414739 RepID=UPI003CE9E5A1